MRILIRDMKMPKNCHECPLFESKYHCHGCHAVPKSFYDIDMWEFVSNYRPSWCPLVELPPHGRLIDERWLKDAMATTLEALIKNPKMDAQEMHIIAAFDTLREMIDDAPTIIESEGEE